MFKTAKIIKSALMSAALTAFSTAAVSGPNDYEKLPIKAGTLYYKSDVLQNGNTLVKRIWLLQNGGLFTEIIGKWDPVQHLLCEKYEIDTPERCQQGFNESKFQMYRICKLLGFDNVQGWYSRSSESTEEPVMLLDEVGSVATIKSDGVILDAIECTNSPQPPGN